MHPRPRTAPAALVGLLLLVLVGPLSSAAARARSLDPVPAPAGGAVWPLAPVPDVVEGFDPPESRWGAGHRGVDLAGAAGQPVRAAAAGTVTFAGSLSGRGVVVVDHGGTRTTYEPVEATVVVGDRVAAGDRIGVLRRGGSHCFPAVCLHWGLRAGDTYLDPLTLVGRDPVRLMPLDGLPSGGLLGSLRLLEPGTTFPTWERDLSGTAAGAAGSGPRGAAASFREFRGR